MIRSSPRERKIWNWVIRVAAASPARLSASIPAVLIGGVLLGVVVRAYHTETAKGVLPTKASTAPLAATGPVKQRRLLTRLSFQPEANRMRRRLGKRFVVPGREVAVTTGVLTMGSDRQPVRIVRTQDDEQGEQVSIAIGTNPASFAWTPKAGAVSSGNPLTGNERAAVERIALDSPDQFILAQTRGASYYTIAHAVRPAEAGDSDGSVPFWDLIRIGEPQLGSFSKPQSLWRIYYINNSTGLIDRIFYQEQTEDVTVELSGWTSRGGGELAPSLIRWTRGKTVVMELNLASISYGARE